MTSIPLPIPFKEQMEVEARFMIPLNAPGFQANCLNLLKFESWKDDHDVMIHCRIDKDQLLMSTKKDGTWLVDKEVVIPYPGLGTPGNVVTLRVQARYDHFFVTINGDRGHKYPYQLSYTDVNMAYVQSDLEFYIVFPHL